MSSARATGPIWCGSVEVQALAYGGLLPAALVLVWCVRSPVTRRGAMLVAGLGAILLLSLLPYGVQTWRNATRKPVPAFAPWREAIPAGAEVLWPDPPPLNGSKSVGPATGRSIRWPEWYFPAT